MSVRVPAGPTLAGVAAIAVWTTLALLARAAADVPPLQTTAMAFAVPGVLGLVWLAWRGRLGVLRQKPVAWVHGVGGLFGYHALLFVAFAFAPAVEVNLINYFWPLLVVLLGGALLGLRLTWRHVAGTVLALGGCVLMVGQGAAFRVDALFGYAAAAACAVIWALYSVMARRLASVPTEAVVGFCALTALLAAALHVLTETTVVPDPPAWLAILGLGLGPVGGAFFLWDLGMKRGDPLLLGTLAYATPVLSTLWLIVAGEAAFTPRVMFAALLVAAGGLLAARADVSVVAETVPDRAG